MMVQGIFSKLVEYIKSAFMFELGIKSANKLNFLQLKKTQQG